MPGEVPLERKPTLARRAQALFLGLVPGLAHILLLDRTGWGALYFVLFVLGADAALAGLYLLDEAWAGDAWAGGCAVAGGAWLVSFLDMARLTLFRDFEARAALRRKLTADGVRLYAAGRHRKARVAFRDCLDLDHRDPDVLFWYGCVESALGRPKRARRALRRCRKYDVDGRWAFQAKRLEARIDRPPRPATRPAAAPPPS
jgi:hypothetical protein